MDWSEIPQHPFTVGTPAMDWNGLTSTQLMTDPIQMISEGGTLSNMFPGGMDGMNFLLQHMLANMQQQDHSCEMSISDTASSSEEVKTGSMRSSDSNSPSQSISPPIDRIDETVESIIDSIHNHTNEGIIGKNDLSSLSSMNILSSSSSSNRDSYYECYRSTNREEVGALIYSLFVASRGIGKEGYENFECFSRTKHKCRYKVRCKLIDGMYIVEERGCHSHQFDGSAFSSQGLPKQIREIVDVSFNEGWNNQRRQETIDELVNRMGLPPNPKMNRQIDNRLSYLRRTKNISSSSSSSSHSLVPSSLSSQLAALLSTPIDTNPMSTPMTDTPPSSDFFDVNSLAQFMVAQQEAMASIGSLPN